MITFARIRYYECGEDGKPCDEEGCQECCPHEFDSSEGGYCCECDKHITD